MKYEEFKDEIENFHYDDGIHQIGAGYFLTNIDFYLTTVLNTNGSVIAAISNSTTDDFYMGDVDAFVPTSLKLIIARYAATHIDDREIPSNYFDFDAKTIFNHRMISLASAKNEKSKTITKDFIDEMKKKNVDSEISKDRRTITLKRNGKTIAHVSTVIRYKASIMVDLPKDLAEPILRYTSTSAKDRGETPADPNDVNITLHGEKAKAFRNVLRNLQSVNVNHLEPESVVLNIRDVDIYNTDVFSRILLRISEKINQSSERK